MADADFDLLNDHQGRAVRLTHERWAHILSHPEMADQRPRIEETLASPDVIVATGADASVHAYHRLYEQTPVTRKYLLVAVKILEEDAFVVTAFFTSRLKKGTLLWPP